MKALPRILLSLLAKQNLIVHQAETASQEEAEPAIAVAAWILEEIFPGVVKKLGLYLHGTTVRDVSLKSSDAAVPSTAS